MTSWNCPLQKPIPSCNICSHLLHPNCRGPKAPGGPRQFSQSLRTLIAYPSAARNSERTRRLTAVCNTESMYHVGGMFLRRNQSLSFTESIPPSSDVVDSSIPDTVIIPGVATNRSWRRRSNSVDGIMDLDYSGVQPTSDQGYFTERKLPPVLNKKNSSRQHRSSPDLILSTDFQQSSGSMDAAVDRAASRLGVAVPHSNFYPTHSTLRHSSSMSRREQRLRERELQRQQCLPTARYMEERSSEPPNRVPTYAPSVQCNPVSPMVLQNLPTISVRHEDLFPEEDAAHGSQLGCSIDSLSLEGGYASSDSLSIGLDAILTPYSCTICCEDIEIDTNAVRLPCAHLYHAECISTWLSKFNTCPVCRFALPTLADFTTAPSAKLFQSNRNEPSAQKPMQFTKKELQDFSMEQLQKFYKSWVICTFNTQHSSSQKKLSIELPVAVVDDKRALIHFLMDRQVILRKRSCRREAPKRTRSKEDLRSMSIRDLKALVPSSAAALHIVEKQELIQIILEQDHPSTVGGAVKNEY